MTDSFEWIDPQPGWMLRAAHAVALDGRVWVLDPFDQPGAEEGVRALGEPAGVVQLLDRHGRDCAAWAQRLGVKLHVLPAALAPWEVIPIPSLPGWREVALWHPGTATLVVADALAAAPGYSGGADKVAVHPLLRPRPPRRLGAQPVRHLLLGHGPGVHGPEAEQAVAHALETTLTGIPGFAAGLARSLLGR